jgi:molybdopterin-guanine dinucleotide biosynthesis protein A
MGEDKGLMKWHGREQRYYVADLLKAFCEEVFISCRPDQVSAMHNKYKTIVDEYEDGGPLGAIISAFHSDKNGAWLVIACDLPLIDHDTIGYLIENRNPFSSATTFRSPHDELPEPLITIWEPEALPLMEMALADGKKCPRKVLLNATTSILQAPDPMVLTNANTPEEKFKVMEALKIITVE